MNVLDVVSAAPYNVFYALGFAVAYGAAAWHARRRGWPMLPWLALLAACVAGGIAGSKLLHFDLEPALPGEKTVLGGVTGGVIALFIVQRFLRVPGGASRVLAPAALIGFALGRVGCFLAGCCFGAPTSAPWAVRYAPGTRPFAAQLDAGLIDGSTLASLPVHPTQLYEAILGVALATLLVCVGPRLRSAGGVALALAVGFGLLRVAIQPLRFDGGTAVFAGLALVQWTVLLGVLAAAAVLVVRERSAGTLEQAMDAARATGLPAGATFVVGSVLALLALEAGWLTPLERVVLAAAVLPAALLALRRAAVLPAPALATLAVVPLASDSIPAGGWFTIGAGATTGRFETVRDLSPGDDCGPAEYRAHGYRVLGLSGGYTRRSDHRLGYDIRGRIFGGANQIEHQNTSRMEDVTISGVNVVGSVHVPLSALPGAEDMWGSISGGFVTGRLVSEEGLYGTRIEPAGGVRVGWREFFSEVAYNDHDPAPNPNTRVKVSAGYEFAEHGSNVRFGAWESGGIFVAGRLVTRGGLELEPFIGVLTDDYTHQYGLAVRHRIAGRGGRPWN